MQFTIPTIALFSALASTGYAANVFATIFDTAQKKSPANFDVGNPCCFNLDNTQDISFSQGGVLGSPAGPYCLYAFKAGGCKGPVDGDARKEFRNPTTIPNAPGKRYSLAPEIQGIESHSFKFRNGPCTVVPDPEKEEKKCPPA
ncbi:hypothetical protein BDU57DRAFT_516003 [Ampelomyces quisqualis]|uniref:Ubiquitin 3 binding protein But2 C-terminal domain-containing protein n=1 Tax=Ampelomyces quisqualis TaxID=50730 RepID=A0A6A5QMH3_AMPQU|nr:hypothetical protein BDU57DRAFT_516003 [Ampelomyces quisqualis]